MKFVLLSIVLACVAQAVLGLTTRAAQALVTSEIYITDPSDQSDCPRELCLDIKGGKLVNGAFVHMAECNESAEQEWEFHANAAGQVKVKGSNFCLDAGSSPANGLGLKIWQCFDNLPQQQWFTAINRISLASKPLCTDMRDGIFAAGKVVQLWQCSSANANQAWEYDSGN